jgi:hypothetical protein
MTGRVPTEERYLGKYSVEVWQGGIGKKGVIVKGGIDTYTTEMMV